MGGQYRPIKENLKRRLNGKQERKWHFNIMKDINKNSLVFEFNYFAVQLFNIRSTKPMPDGTHSCSVKKRNRIL